MDNNLPDDDLLRSYLLGDLPEEEADRLEKRLLADDELFLLAEAVEADLLAAASRGELTPAERKRALHRLASSPQGRERFAMAQALNAAAEAELEKVPREAVVIPMPRPVPRSHTAWWMALAASLLLMAGLGWFAWQHRAQAPAVPSRVAVATPRPTAPPAATPAPRETIAEKAPEPAPDRVARQETPQRPAVRPEPVKAVLQLALATTRSSGHTETLSLPDGASTAEIQIDASGLEDLAPFHVTVRSLEKRTIWEAAGVKPRSLDWGPALVIEIPAERLSAGRYEIAVISESEPEPMEMTQEFEVEKD